MTNAASSNTSSEGTFSTLFVQSMESQSLEESHPETSLALPLRPPPRKMWEKARRQLTCKPVLESIICASILLYRCAISTFIEYPPNLYHARAHPPPQ